MDIHEENCKLFENWRKVMKLWIIILLKKQHKETNKIIY